MQLVWSVLQILVEVLGWATLTIAVAFAALVLVIKRRREVGSAIAAKVMTEVVTRMMAAQQR